MTRVTSTLLILVFAAVPALADGFTGTAVGYRSDVPLAAELFLPEGDGPFPAAVIIQGSGDSDRTNGWARQWARALASRGVAALLTDKRGCGKSGGDWKTAGFDDLARDVVSGVAFLRTHSSIDKRRVGVVGLSQGGFYAPLAATMDEGIAFVASASSATTTPRDQVNHEMRNTFREVGLPDEGVEAGMQLQKLAEGYVRTGAWEPYAAVIASAKKTPLAPVAEGFPQSRDSWVWGFWKKIGDFDPIAYWSTLRVPALVILGSDDESDNVPVAKSVERLQPLVEKNSSLHVVVIEGAGHAVHEPGTTNLHPEALAAIDALVRSAGRDAQP